MNPKIYIRIIIALFIFAFCIRIINWPIIKDINCDEAMSAINAQAIAKTGKDIYGTSFPVYFEAWGIWRSTCFRNIFNGIMYKII